jgi:autotransporter passenger strand-loop-strand repeat protein
VNSLSDLLVSSGAISFGAVIVSTGFEGVYGGVTSAEIVSRGGTQDVFVGGRAVNTSVFAGGEENVSGYALYGSGTATGTRLYSASVLNDHGTTFGVQVKDGGAEIVSAVASGTIIFSGGVAAVVSGGVAYDTVVSSGGVLVVLPGGVASHTTGTVLSTGVLIEQPGSGYVGESYTYHATATGQVLGFQAFETVLSGGLALKTTLSGGEQMVESGGRTVSTVITDGGYEIVNSGGAASAGVTANGNLYVESGGKSFAARVMAGGTEDLSGLASGTVVSAAGLLFAQSGAVVAGVVVAGGYATINAGVALSGTVTFTGSGGVLELDAPAVPRNTISGFVAGDTVFLGGVAYASGAAARVLSAGVVTISAGGTTVALDVAGAKVGETDFVVSSGYQGYGLDLTKTSAAPAVHGMLRASMPWRAVLVVSPGHIPHF